MKNLAKSFQVGQIDQFGSRSKTRVVRVREVRGSGFVFAQHTTPRFSDFGHKLAKAIGLDEGWADVMATATPVVRK